MNEFFFSKESNVEGGLQNLKNLFVRSFIYFFRFKKLGNFTKIFKKELYK